MDREEILKSNRDVIRKRLDRAEILKNYIIETEITPEDFCGTCSHMTWEVSGGVCNGNAGKFYQPIETIKKPGWCKDWHLDGVNGTKFGPIKICPVCNREYYKNFINDFYCGGHLPEDLVNIIKQKDEKIKQLEEYTTECDRLSVFMDEHTDMLERQVRYNRGKVDKLEEIIKKYEDCQTCDNGFNNDIAIKNNGKCEFCSYNIMNPGRINHYRNKEVFGDKN